MKLDISVFVYLKSPALEHGSWTAMQDVCYSVRFSATLDFREEKTCKEGTRYSGLDTLLYDIGEQKLSPEN